MLTKIIIFDIYEKGIIIIFKRRYNEIYIKNKTCYMFKIVRIIKKECNMEIKLEKATIENVEEIHQMQIKSFKSLLEKYKDYDTNPGNENIERIIQRFYQEFTDYYIIKMDNISVGAIRVVRLENDQKCRVSPIFILPEYYNKGIAQKVFEIIEERYKPKNGWILDTILQEKGNCYLYEKIGYKKTGQIEYINDNMNIVFYEKKDI